MPVTIKPTGVIKARLGLQTNGPVQKFFASTCAIHMDKYVPFRSGTLAKYRIEGSNIIYRQPYAHYQYMGVSKSGNKLNYSKQKHPHATHHWNEKMVTAEMKDVELEVQKFINRGGK